MSEAKFTKGEWHVVDMKCRGISIDSDTGLSLAAISNDFDSDIHNAHIMAVAPEMYDAMQEFVDRVDRGEVRSTTTYNKFKLILSKARGES